MCEDNNNPFADTMLTNKRLVACRCSKCGNVSIGCIHLTESNITICRYCGDSITIRKVTYGNVKCPNCLTSTRILLANGLKGTICRKCGYYMNFTYYRDSKNILRAKLYNK